MHFNLRAIDNKAFTTSLYEIDRILSDRAAELASNESASNESASNESASNESASNESASNEALAWDEAVKKVLPQEYWDYIDVFLKAESDKLPPHRPYDHKIELEAENTLGYSPLYKMSNDELETVK
jgi:hypothetical protein